MVVNTIPVPETQSRGWFRTEKHEPNGVLPRGVEQVLSPPFSSIQWLVKVLEENQSSKSSGSITVPISLSLHPGVSYPPKRLTAWPERSRALCGKHNEDRPHAQQTQPVQTASANLLLHFFLGFHTNSFICGELLLLLDI
jgi:hypothetical protein